MDASRFVVSRIANPEAVDWLGRPNPDPLWTVVDRLGVRAPATHIYERHAREHAAWLNARAGAS
jgi:hypothetical protein